MPLIAPLKRKHTVDKGIHGSIPEWHVLGISEAKRTKKQKPNKHTVIITLSRKPSYTLWKIMFPMLVIEISFFAVNQLDEIAERLYNIKSNFEYQSESY